MYQAGEHNVKISILFIVHISDMIEVLDSDLLHDLIDILAAPLCDADDLFLPSLIEVPCFHAHRNR